jgi:hypothetical protein
MSTSYCMTDNPQANAWQQDNGCDVEKWQRWDEELVAEFGLWVARLTKTGVVMAAGVLVCFLVGWF